MVFLLVFLWSSSGFPRFSYYFIAGLRPTAWILTKLEPSKPPSATHEIAAPKRHHTFNTHTHTHTHTPHAHTRIWQHVRGMCARWHVRDFVLSRARPGSVLSFILASRPPPPNSMLAVVGLCAFSHPPGKDTSTLKRGFGG